MHIIKTSNLGSRFEFGLYQDTYINSFMANLHTTRLINKLCDLCRVNFNSY